MKKTILTTLISLVVILISSCSKDSNNENNTNQNNSLIGKWEFFSTTENGVTHDDYNPFGCSRSFLEYKDNNTMTENHFNNIPSPCNIHIYPNNYTFDGTTIKIIYSSTSSFNSTVLTLNSTTLVTSTYGGSVIKTYKCIFR